VESGKKVAGALPEELLHPAMNRVAANAAPAKAVPLRIPSFKKFTSHLPDWTFAPWHDVVLPLVDEYD
jgi:hypothetical protein